jgi:hypothetical protein
VGWLQMFAVAFSKMRNCTRCLSHIPPGFDSSEFLKIPVLFGVTFAHVIFCIVSFMLGIITTSLLSPMQRDRSQWQLNVASSF